MFYIIDNKKTVQAIEKIETGLKVWYTDGVSEDLVISNSSGSNNVNIVDNLISTSTIDALSANQGRILNNKIPNKCVVGLDEDVWNDGIGIYWSDGTYSRMFIYNIPTISKAIRRLDVEDDGTISVYTVNSGSKVITPPYTTDISLEQETGVLRVTKANNTIFKEIDFKNYIQSVISQTQGLNLSEIDFTKYYKVINGDNIAITEKEFNELQHNIKYFKELNNETIEITEEEFHNTNTEKDYD